MNGPNATTGANPARCSDGRACSQIDLGGGFRENNGADVATLHHPTRRPAGEPLPLELDKQFSNLGMG